MLQKSLISASLINPFKAILDNANDPELIRKSVDMREDDVREFEKFCDLARLLTNNNGSTNTQN